jgi:hypothetical protein
MQTMVRIGIVTVFLTACQGPGYGVKEADHKAATEKTTGTEQPSAQPESPAGVPDKTPGFSIWSMFGGNKEFVRKRLEPGLGHTKKEQVAKLGTPVQCTPHPKGGEICLWHDKGMAEGGTSDPSMHQVYYSFDKDGMAQEWDYRGVYGKLSSRDALFDSPAPAPKQP